MVKWLTKKLKRNYIMKKSIRAINFWHEKMLLLYLQTQFLSLWWMHSKYYFSELVSKISPKKITSMTYFWKRFSFRLVQTCYDSITDGEGLANDLDKRTALSVEDNYGESLPHFKRKWASCKSHVSHPTITICTPVSQLTQTILLLVFIY